MNRRETLAVVGSALTAGCASVQRGSQEEMQIKNESIIAVEDFPVYADGDTEFEGSETLASENPENNELYIAHTAQLPTPAHEMEYSVTQTNSNSVEIVYSASYQGSNDTETQSVIQPTPHAIRLELSSLNAGYNITLQPINGDRLTYTTEGKRRTARFEEENTA